VGSQENCQGTWYLENTVKRYLRQDGWIAYAASHRQKTLRELSGWLNEAFRRHNGNAEVLRQELVAQHQIKVSLRTVERAVQLFRRQELTATKATVRFETLPGEQLQIDFGSMQIMIGSQKIKTFLFVATLGYSRRRYVKVFTHERQSAWFEGMEGAFRHFGGMTKEVLLDNPKSLVTRHNIATREVVFNDRFRAFSEYWKFRPIACAPYRARTKGKDESSVGYVKKNCIAGRDFLSWEVLEQHCLVWMREIADSRVHGTTGERSDIRFERDEASALQPLNGKPPFQQIRELHRVIHNDACVEVDTNHYSVPWSLISHQVTVHVTDGLVRIFQGSNEVACHIEVTGRKQRCVDPEHLKGIIGATRQSQQESLFQVVTDIQQTTTELLRPLAEYEAVVGGGWL
jgi:transposase